jgi:hypothetical protein
MSERLSISSTKYGPSVSAGVTTHWAFVEVGELVEPGEEEDVDEEDEGELASPPPQLPRTPTAITEPSIEIAPRRSRADVSPDLRIIHPPRALLTSIGAGAPGVFMRGQAHGKPCKALVRSRWISCLAGR